MRYKNMMKPIEAILAKKGMPVSATSGLLSPTKTMAATKKDTSVEEKIAGYIAIFRKQRQELGK